MKEMHLFAGAGGGILGGMLLGHTPVCAVEIEPFCQAVLKQRQADGILPEFPIFSDIKEFDGTPWRGRVDVIAGGFPCQDISAAGKGAGIHGERSSLFFELARVVREVAPRYVFLENSPMLVHRGLDVVLGTLADMGYDAAWGVISAADCGANHLRKRVWILARRGDVFPHAQHEWIGWGQQQSEGIEKTDVADSVCSGSPPERQRSWEQGGLGERSQNVADAAGIRWTEGRERAEQPGSEPDASGEVVANSISSRLEGLPRDGKDLDEQGWLFEEQERPTCPGGVCRDGGADVADAMRCAGEQHRNDWGVGRGWELGKESRPRVRQGQTQSGLGRVVNGLAPRLDCHYMEHPDWWQVEPEIPRVSPSQPNRVHRLKALGNGQVPRVAATAWVVLEKILRGEG